MGKTLRLCIAAAFILCAVQTASAETIHLTDRMVHVSGGINGKMIAKATKKLLEFDSESDEVIWLMIDSFGGAVDAGFILIDTIKGMRSPVHAVVLSKAYSMGAIITAFCAKRYIYPHATMMFHEASYGAMGEDPTIRSRIEFNTRYLDRMHVELAKILRLSHKAYREKIRDAWWVLADEAVAAHMVDHIVTGVTYKKLPVTTKEIKRTRTTKEKRTYRRGKGDKILDGKSR